MRPGQTPEQLVSGERVQLHRTLTLPLVVLYGLGVTIGAGIYVLIGATAGIAGVYAPLSFVVAAIVMLPSACSFAELVGRLPMSAGEAAYVRSGFRSDSLSLIVGLMVVSVGTISAAAICAGSVGYVRQFIDLPGSVLIPMIVALMTCVAAWGVRESVSFAAVLTVIEIGGLFLVIGGGFFGFGEQLATLQVEETKESLLTIGLGVMSGGVVAFFAFIGFEDLVNMAEETERPASNMPKAIFLTLLITTVLYVLVAIVAVSHVSIAQLAAAEAPLSLVFRSTTGLSPAVVSAIAIIATLNGVIIQIIMASRVIYGLAQQGNLPSSLGKVSSLTHTPLLATVLVGGLVFVLASLAPLHDLAKATSLITLSIFALVNVALLLIKRRGDAAPPEVFVVPGWVPLVGVVCSVLFLIVGLTR